jgi:hypothetical protein
MQKKQAATFTNAEPGIVPLGPEAVARPGTVVVDLFRLFL